MQKRQPEKGKAPVASTTEASSAASPYQKESNMSDSKVVQVSSQPVFIFGDHAVRVVVRDGEPWFVASDVAKALEFRDASNAARMLSDHQKGTHSVSTVQGNQQLTVVSEGGLYRMVLRSRKPSAVAFSDWVTDEVLPAIRKTGVYVGKAFAVNPGDVLTQEEQNTLRLMLKSAADRQPKTKQGALMVQGWSKLKSHFKTDYRHIPRQEFSEAVSIIARHTAEWELVDDEPKAGTVQEIVADWVKKIEEPNGYPACLFQPVVDAVQRKQGKTPAQPSDASHTLAAFDAAASVVADVQRKVFGAVMAGTSDWKHQRWLVAFIDDSNKSAPAYVRPMERGAFVATWPGLVKDVATGECMCTSAELIEMASACMQRLQQRGGPVRLAASAM